MDPASGNSPTTSKVRAMGGCDHEIEISPKGRSSKWIEIQGPNNEPVAWLQASNAFFQNTPHTQELLSVASVVSREQLANHGEGITGGFHIAGIFKNILELGGSLEFTDYDEWNLNSPPACKKEQLYWTFDIRPTAGMNIAPYHNSDPWTPSPNPVSCLPGVTEGQIESASTATQP
jgi:hypothetical protein